MKNFDGFLLVCSSYSHRSHFYFRKLPLANTPCPSASVTINFCTRDYNWIQRIQWGSIKKIELTGASWFSTGELSKNFPNIYLDHFHNQLCLKNIITCCYHLTLMDNCQIFIKLSLTLSFLLKSRSMISLW